MDVNAVHHATREDLHQLGLEEKGHILCLKAFALKSYSNYDISSSDNLKESLASSIKNASIDRTVAKKQKFLKPKVVQVGWKHSSHKKTYVQVRKASGGGVREMSFSLNDTLQNVLKESLNLFFPGGKSKKFGLADTMLTELGDFSGDAILNLDQSLQDYIRSVKMTGRTKLYLLTQKKGTLSVKELLRQACDTDSDDDFEIPTFKTKGKSTFLANCKIFSKTSDF